jgi:polyisoprenyl-phosphate glycosyltransferase
MLLSIVVPVLNEAQSIPLLLSSLHEALSNVTWEVIFVDDGSTDETWGVLERSAAADSHVKMLRFSRNFGHQAAVTAGLDFAGGNAVVVMDADLQDPPELLPRMLALYYEGYDIVSPQRISRDAETTFKRWTATVFYRLLSRMADQQLTPDVGDFRLFSRRAVLAIRSMREQHRYMRGMAAWLGLREAVIPFERKKRVAGHTNYSLFKMLRFAWTGVSSFSAFPLRISVAAGCLLSCAGFMYLLYVIYVAMWTKQTVPGWASVVALQCAFSGVILLALGAIGDYVARTYEEAKGRPLYVVSDLRHVPPPEQPLSRAVLLVESEVPSTVGVNSFVLGPTEEEKNPAYNSVVGAKN